MLTYLRHEPLDTDGPPARIGVISRRTEQSATTGRALISVRAHTDPPEVVTRWVHESDVVKRCPPHLMAAIEAHPDLLH